MTHKTFKDEVKEVVLSVTRKRYPPSGPTIQDLKQNKVLISIAHEVIDLYKQKILEALKDYDLSMCSDDEIKQIIENI